MVRGRRRGNHHSFRKSVSDTSRNWVKQELSEEEEPVQRKLPPFLGTASLNEAEVCEKNCSDADDKEQFSDSEWECSVNTSVQDVPSIPVMCKSLSSLMGLYASESEAEEKTQTTSSLCQGSDSGPEEAPILRKSMDVGPVSASAPVSTTNNAENPRKRRGHHRSKVKPTVETKRTPYIPRRKLTLLQKLLSCEIRHERNVILQCIRHVVQNNFFSPVTSDSSKLVLSCIHHVVSNRFFDVETVLT